MCLLGYLNTNYVRNKFYSIPPLKEHNTDICVQSSKYIQSFHLPNDIQVISIEVNLKRRKLLIVSIYRPPEQKLAYFLSSITDLLDHYLKAYEDFIVIGDFN